MKEITVDATLDNFERVKEFIETQLTQYDCPQKSCVQIIIATEEIYVNIANYAYHPHTGKVTITFDALQHPNKIQIQFMDSGTPFNPLEKKDADISLPMLQREIGGLGILMAKKMMDLVEYSYTNEKNILTMQKKL